MEELFGIPMDQLLIGLLVLFGVGTAVMAVIALRNPVLFKTAVRNIPRRRTQTALIVLGLMLATLLFSAALATGDTISHSIRLGAVNELGLVDVTVSGEEDETTGQPAYFDVEQVESVRDALADDELVVGVTPIIRETAAVSAPKTNLSEPRVGILGVEQASLSNFNQIETADGSTLSVDDLAENEVFISQGLADELDIGTNDTVQIFLGQTPFELDVTDIYEEGPKPSGNLSIAFSLSHLQTLIGRAGEINLIAVTNEGDEISGGEHGEIVVETLEPIVSEAGLLVEADKAVALETADLIGNLFSSIFLLFGQFSIAAGILLIFLIFVMLAAERKQELGIARAIGMQRSHVIRMFTFEGAMYSIMAAAVGSFLGVFVGWFIARVMAVAFGNLASDFFNITFFFNPRSPIIAYTLGMVFTFVVVLISSWRVSRLNVVRAIRDIPEPRISRKSIKGWIFTILFLLLSVFVTLIGIQVEVLSVFLLGASLAIIAVPLLIWRFGAPDRLVFSLAGIGLLVWWLAPVNPIAEAIFPNDEGDISLFFISGIMVVLGAVWTVIYNSDLLTSAILVVLGRFKGFPSIAKTAVAYSMSSRFRTGMTLALFSLIVFTLVVMSFIILATSEAFGNVDRIADGYEIQAQAGYANPIDDIETAIEDAPDLNGDDFEVVTTFTTMPVQLVEQDVTDDDGNLVEQEPSDFVVASANQAFFENSGYDFLMMAKGYETADDVWQALSNGEDVAVVNPFMVPASGGIFITDGDTFSFQTFTQEDETIPEVYLTIISPFTGQSREVRIIGVFADFGVYTGGPVLVAPNLLADLTPVALPASSYIFRVNEGVDVSAVSQSLESSFVENGLQASVIAEDIAEQSSVNLAINNLIQGFMSLGLVVGIAALGVIAARSVVERYHQIGVLRAIGFQSRMVQMIFILESSFVTLLGIALGIGLGMAISWNVIQSFAEDTPSITYIIPWANIILIVVVTYGAALLMTLLTSRQAAKVQPAEALRFE